MKRLAFVIAILVGLLSSTNQTIQADEPAQAFLKALRDNGYHDVAIEYLESMKSSELVSPEFKAAIPFELAQTMIQSTVRMRDLTLVESRLDEAQKLLTQYAAQNQSLEVSARTLHYQANLLFRRASIYMKQSLSDRLTANEKEALFVKARSNLQQSLDSYQQAKSNIRKLIDPQSPDAIRIDPEDPTSLRRRSQFQASYTDVRASIPKITEQLADTYALSSGERQTLLQNARDEYQKVWDAYPKYLAGLESCVYSARCNYKLGEYKKALNQLSDIFALGNNSVLKPVKLEAYVLATDCWQKTDPYPYKEVVMRLEPVVAALNKIELRQPEWLRVQMEYAVAKYAKAAEVKSEGGPTANSDGKQMEREAAKVLRNVVRTPSQYRERAATLLSQWKVKITEPTTAQVKKAPTTFDEAQQRGKDIVAELEASLTESTMLKRKLKTANVTERDGLQKQYDTLVQQIAVQSQQALDMLDMALGLADANTIRADINNVRYLQCYCYFATEHYIESALIGEFLLTKYPKVDGTRQAMTLLIQSYSILMDRAKGREIDQAYERQRLAKACDFVLKRWPGSREAGAAASTMARLALNEKDYLSAKDYFDQIPADASYRDSIGVRLGQRIWFAYKAKQKTDNPDADELKTMLADATKYMAEGVNRTSIEQLDYDTALAALLLVDARIQLGQVEKAIARLETETIAPLDLIKQQHPAVTQTTMAGVYRREAYKTAIKSYLAAMDSATDQQKWIDKAAGVINTMRDELKASNDPKDRARVSAIYQLIAKELKENFATLTDAQEKRKFAASLASFLGSIEKESTDAKTVLWAGSTLLGVAESLLDSGLDADAQELFVQAVASLTRAETIGFAGDPLEQKMVVELKRQRALAQRGSGQYEQAVEQFVEILKGNPGVLGVQIDAAQTLQVWAGKNGGPKRYIEAVKGGAPVKDAKTKRTKKLIWGWEKIAMATRGNVKYRETFYEALYHVIECRLEYGVATKNENAIKAAGNEIARERKRDPTFSGKENWKQKFDLIETRVNQAKQSL